MIPELERIKNLKPYSKKYIKEHENELRARIVEIALSYIGARYHVNGLIPRKLCDCHTFLLMVFAEARLIPLADKNIETLEQLTKSLFYRPDFSFHTCKETYLEGIQKIGVEVKEKKAGDIILYRFAKLIDHTAIVIDDNGTMIDSAITRGVTLQDYNQQINKNREVAVYSFWGQE